MSDLLHDVPDELLLPERSPLSDSGRARQLLQYLDARYLRPSLLAVEDERARRRALPQTTSSLSWTTPERNSDDQDHHQGPRNRQRTRAGR